MPSLPDSTLDADLQERRPMRLTFLQLTGSTQERLQFRLTHMDRHRGMAAGMVAGAAVLVILSMVFSAFILLGALPLLGLAALLYLQPVVRQRCNVVCDATGIQLGGATLDIDAVVRQGDELVLSGPDGFRILLSPSLDLGVLQKFEDGLVRAVSQAEQRQGSPDPELLRLQQASRPVATE